ncbi:DUF6141 family protein [Brevibacillus humidisoli]|uniref:DUF6141 family protein n=1 Tax=Brevibacillus humidisoli TaxID=2895522 RepID=UPI001E3C27AE|nr:DUF6141 family protein [Brevibacillus humidisoli]UFJ42296.1 DUF6141 family protein [Brevibacillus humidisoli]
MRNNRGKRVVYQEVQRFSSIITWISILAVAGIMWYGFVQQIVRGIPFGDKPASDTGLIILVLIFGIAFPLFFFSIRLRTEVRETEIFVSLSPFSSRSIPLNKIEQMDVCTTRPLLKHGGYGLRWSPRNGWAYTMRGKKGVQLTLSDGKKLLIGSQHPQTLAESIKKAIDRADNRNV